jgi:cyclic lactone autoinducer peptide
LDKSGIHFGFFVSFLVFNSKTERRYERMKKKVLSAVAKGLALFAVLFVSTACVWLFHRPEIPEELKS